MNTHLESMDSLSLNLFSGDNSPDTKPSAVLALRLDMSASVIVSAPLPHFRWTKFNVKLAQTANIVASINCPAT